LGKFGKKNVVKDDIFSYNIGVIGESGIGKTTLAKEVCEKVVGEDGYILLNVGREDGIEAIDGIVAEDVPDWKKFSAVINDIVENKDADYPNLRVVVIDTLDQLFEITEPEVIRLHNIENREKKVSSIKAAFGGFMAGEDKAIDLVLDKLWALKTVGVAFMVIGHTKKRDIEDVVTGQTYSTLTTNMSQRYFNAIKTKLHVLGVAFIDREIVKQKTGKKNIVTKEDEIKGKVVSESRRITFRDDNYTIDSKSRFRDIVESIPLDADAFIEAIQNAIASAKGDKSIVRKEPVRKPAEPAREETESDDLDIDDEDAADEPSDDFDAVAVCDNIRTRFKAADKETKAKVKAILNGKTLDENMDRAMLESCLKALA
jgi:septin family protein